MSDVSTDMMSIVSHLGDQGADGLVVRRPLVTDAIGGALLRTYGTAPTLPADLRALLDRLDRRR